MVLRTRTEFDEKCKEQRGKQSANMGVSGNAGPEMTHDFIAPALLPLSVGQGPTAVVYTKVSTRREIEFKFWSLFFGLLQIFK